MFKIANLSEKELISHLMEQNVSQAQQIKMLESKILFLLDQIQKSGIKKDSHNSSLPPSRDLFPVNKSLRPVSILKSGGQKGTTLEMSLTPDKTIDLKSAFCSKCGKNLPLDGYLLKVKGQVVELPPIKPIYEEYRQFSCKCTNCLHEQIADFPLDVNAPIQYGKSVQAFISYLSVYHGAARAVVPYGRLQKMFAQSFSFEERCVKTITFQNSILKNRNYILPCIYDLDIPPDNNGSERAIRNIKVKQKVAGQFKTGQNAFCVIRSVIETLLKRKVEVFPSLIQIISLQPE
jgi:Transposase IS66 family